MALYKRNKIYWIEITHRGKRLQRSTGSSDKVAAQELRYAHLSSQHLRDAANRIHVTNSLHCKTLTATSKNNIADNAMI